MNHRGTENTEIKQSAFIGLRPKSFRADTEIKADSKLILFAAAEEGSAAALFAAKVVSTNKFKIASLNNAGEQLAILATHTDFRQDCQPFKIRLREKSAQYLAILVMGCPPPRLPISLWSPATGLQSNTLQDDTFGVLREVPLTPALSP